MRDYSGKKAYQYLKRADCTFSISSDTFRSEFTSSSSYSSSSSASAASKAAGGGGFDRGSGLYSSLRNMKFHMKIPSTSSSNNKSSGSGGGEVVTSSADSVFGSGSGSSDVGDGSGSTYSSSSSSVAAAGLGEPLSKRRPPSVHSATGGGASGSSSTAFLRDARSGSARRRANSASAFVNHTT